jgi:hypothetical protein
MFSIDNLRAGDARSMGMGGNGVLSSALYNPALSALAERRFIDINYFNKYGIKELGAASGGFVLPGNGVSYGLHIASFGYDEYRESMFRLSLSKRLGERWALGVALRYAMLQTVFDEEDPAQASADIGFVYNSGERLTIGLSIMNYPSASWNVSSSRAPGFMSASIEAGIRWAASDGFFLSGGMESVELREFDFNLGVEYAAYDDFHIRGGLRTAQFMPSFGLSYMYGQFGIDIACVFHPVLGVSSGAGLSFFF